MWILETHQERERERENKKRASRYCRAWDIQFAGGCIYCSPNSLICTHHTHNWVWSPVNTQTHTHKHTHTQCLFSFGVDLISSALFIYYIFAPSFVIFSVLPYPYIHQTHTHTEKNNANGKKQKTKIWRGGDGGCPSGGARNGPSFPTPSIYYTVCCCICILSYPIASIYLSASAARALDGSTRYVSCRSQFFDSVLSRRRMKWTFIYFFIYLFFLLPRTNFWLFEK